MSITLKNIEFINEDEDENEEEFSFEEEQRMIEQIRLKRQQRDERDKLDGFVPNKISIFDMLKKLEGITLVEEGQGSTGQTHQTPPRTQNPPPTNQSQNQPQTQRQTTFSANTPYYDTINTPPETYSTGNFSRFQVSSAPEELICPYGRNVRSKGKKITIRKTY